jgi:hypothetical protein
MLHCIIEAWYHVNWVIAITSMGRKRAYKLEAKGLKNGSIDISKLNQMFKKFEDGPKYV